MGKGATLENEADEDRPVVILDLTVSDASLLGARRLKIVDAVPVPVTFEDKWGAIATDLADVRAILEDESLELSEKPIDREKSQFAHGFANALASALPQVKKVI